VALRYWILCFSPETYGVVKEKGVIGVRMNARKRFVEDMGSGDKFITYVSRIMKLDGWGTIESDAFAGEDNIFCKDKVFPYRRQVCFEEVGLEKSADQLFFRVEPFNKANTQPGNYMMCKGGFVEISQKDFEWLKAQLLDS
jgi:hypothetical protein